MEKWLHDGLTNCLGFPVPDEMVKHILSIKDAAAFDEYFDSLLNKDCDDHCVFLNNCKQRLLNKSQNQNKKTPQNNRGKQKEKKDQSAGSSEIKHIQGSPGSNSTKKALKPEQDPQNGTKKKVKYVNLYANDGKMIGDTIMLKGRRHCDCQAAQHKLINNCLGCGRIVCEQEGSGPCLFCGEMVCSNEDMQILKENSKRSGKLLKTLKEKGGGEALKKALEQRDRLLEYDRFSEKRTTVIDDELDYFQENSVWLSEAEREKFERLKQEMHEQKHASRASRKIKIDFAGRTVDDDAPAISEDYERKVLQEIADTSASVNDGNNWSNRQHSIAITPETCDSDPRFEGLRPIFREASAGGKMKPANVQGGLEHIYNRVQDKELMEMQDMRKCLSMHQPWASLLVAGIKKHEGRVWYSGHRGRLWIASTAKEAKSEEIEEMENFYRNYYNDRNLKFPEHYPTGCLLGCVKVEDCLPQEQYRELYPDGESESPYVFVCSNPEPLPVVFPVKGQHKIYEIDPKIHHAACKTMLRAKAKGAVA